MRKLLFAIPIVTALVSAVPALADDMFTLTSGADTITFSLPASPAPAGSCFYTDGFCETGVSVTADGTNYPDEFIEFFTATNDGGLIITNSSNSSVLVNLYNTVLFTGGVSTPTFTPGDYGLIAGGSPLGQYNENFELVIAAPTAATPEPSSLALLGTGLLGAAGLARRRLFHP